MKCLKNFFTAALLIFAVAFCGVVEAGIITDRLPFQCYVDHQVYTYDRPNGKRVGYISANVDNVVVQEVRPDGWAYGHYPVSNNKRVLRWFKVSELCADPGYSNRGTNVKGNQSVYRTKDSSATFGSVSNNESVIVLADNGNRAQILYRLNNGTGYKVGWVPSSSVGNGDGGNDTNIKGDANNDGKVDESDLNLIRNYIVGNVGDSAINKNNADMNGDGQINIIDMSALLSRIKQADFKLSNYDLSCPSDHQLRFRGRVWNANNNSERTGVHVYIGGGAGAGGEFMGEFTSDSNHNFDATLNVPQHKNGNQLIVIYAVNGKDSGELNRTTINVGGNNRRDNLNITTQDNNSIAQRIIGPSANYAQPANGEYYIVPANNGNFAIDVPNNWTNEGNILQIFGRNNSPAQTFRLERVSGEWYRIVHPTSGHVINVQWGHRNNATQLWLYHYDGTASCHWRFRDLGNGVYNIESQLETNPFLEVQNGNPFNNAILQIWQQHNGDAAKWRLVKATNDKADFKLSNYDLSCPSDHQLRFRGRVWNANNNSERTGIHVYIGGGAGAGGEFMGEFTSDSNHNFDATLNVPQHKNGNQLIVIYAVNGKDSGELNRTTINVGGDNSKDFPSSIYLTQIGKSTCTLVSSAMMLRAKAYLNGDSNWSSITESSLKSTAWISGQGLRWNFTYNNIQVGSSPVSGIPSSTLKSLLNQHPEGIVIHCKHLPHAVWVISYDGDTFYCSDPLRNYSEDKRPLANSYLGRKLGNQSNILVNITRIWYVK